MQHTSDIKTLIIDGITFAKYTMEYHTLYLKAIPNLLTKGMTMGELEDWCISAIQKIEKTTFETVSFLNV